MAAAAEAKKDVKVVLGTMEMGRPNRVTESLEASEKLVEMFLASGSGDELDTALLYSGGKTEKILGQMASTKKGTTRIACKANPWGDNTLTEDGVQKQLRTSLASLGVKSVDLFYLHAPDSRVDIRDTLKGVAALYKDGLFKRFGLSNFSAKQVSEIHAICKANDGYPVPVVYQGMLNALTRAVEDELFPVLRKLNMSFFAYNPLCGGILTGKHKFEDATKKDAKPSRFTDASAWAKKYRERFWNKQVFESLDVVKKACAEANVEPVAAALRWVLHHSMCSGKHGDALIIGASDPKHLEQNLAACKQGPLPKAIVDAFEAGWEKCKEVCPAYSR